MREIRLEKITLNMGAGESGPKLEKAKAIMEKIVGRNVVTTATHKRTTFGMAKKRPIGVMILLRGDEAMSWLKKFLQAADNKIKVTQFDTTGNFSLGVAEYISIPGIKYDPDVGIMGLDVAVTLGRPGFRVKRRRIKPQKIGKAHRITREESIEWAKRELGAEIVGEK